MLFNEKLYAARLRALDRALSRATHSLAGASVLDVGCGTGLYTEYCLDHGVKSYVGLDVTNVSVLMLKAKYPQLEFRQADISQSSLEFPSTFDIVLVPDVLYHITDDQRFETALQNLGRALRIGGLLAITDVFPSSSWTPAQHVRLRSLDVYAETLTNAGLEPITTEPIFVALHPGVSPSSRWGLQQVYELLSKLLVRMARIRLFQSGLPEVLSWLDDAVLLPLLGSRFASLKWLVAVRPDG